jgi:hypothetical protein
LRGLRADHAMWSAFVADHALTSAIVDRTRGLRADLTRSAFPLENAAASSFQQGDVVSLLYVCMYVCMYVFIFAS